MSGTSGHNSEVPIVNNPQEFYCDALKFYADAQMSDSFGRRRFSCHAILSSHLTIFTFMDQELNNKTSPTDPLTDIHELNFKKKKRALKNAFRHDDINLLNSILDDVEFLNHLRNAIVHNRKIDYTKTTSLSLNIFNLFSDYNFGRDLCIESTASLAIETAKTFVRRFYTEVLKKPVEGTFTIDVYDPDICF